MLLKHCKFILYFFFNKLNLQSTEVGTISPSFHIWYNLSKEGGAFLNTDLAAIFIDTEVPNKQWYDDPIHDKIDQTDKLKIIRHNQNGLP